MAADKLFIFQLNCSILQEIPLEDIFNLSDCHKDDELSYESSPFPLVSIAMQIFHSLILIGGITGNVLVIHVVLKYSKMQTVTNLYILNLAVADVLYLLGLPFLIITTKLSRWVFGNTMCKLYMIATSLNQFTSSLFLTVMSADRYIAVCHPISSPKYRTSLISKIVSLTAWTIATLMIVPIFMYSTTADDGTSVHCNMYWPNSSNMSGQAVFILYSFLLSFILPLFFIFVFYMLVVKKLSRIGSRSRSVERRKSQKKVTRLVFTLIIVYVMCYLPYWSLQITLSFMPPKTEHSPFLLTLFLTSSCLSYTNSAVNPILYAFLSDNFKKSFKRACDCGFNITPRGLSIRRMFKRKTSHDKSDTVKKVGDPENGVFLNYNQKSSLTSNTSQESKISKETLSLKQEELKRRATDTNLMSPLKGTSLSIRSSNEKKKIYVTTTL